MSAATPVIFSHTVEAFLTRIFARRNLLNGDVARKLEALGVDIKKPRDLPTTRWWDLVHLAADTIAGGLPQVEAFREVGREMLRGFEATVVGKSLFLVMRVMGVRRAMLKMADNYRTADNATQVSVRELGPTAMELTFTVQGGHPWPSYTQGILEEGIRLVGGREPSVTYAPGFNGAVVYTATWR